MVNFFTADHYIPIPPQDAVSELMLGNQIKARYEDNGHSLIKCRNAGLVF
jgi:hypothetical protein